MTQHLRTCKLVDIAAPIPNATVGGPFGSDLVSRDYVTTGVPVIRGENLSHGRWVGGGFAFVTEGKAESLSSNLARPGDVVFTQRGTLGQVALVPNAPYSRYLVSQSQMKLTVDPRQADALFIYYYFSSAAMQQYIRQHAIQTGVPHTNLTILRNTPVELPDVQRQKSVAGVLGVLDDKIERNQRMVVTLHDTADSVYAAWVRREVPSTVNSVGAMIDDGTLTVGDGYRAKNTELTADGVPFARAADVDGIVRVGSGDALAHAKLPLAGDKVSREWDVVVTTKGTIGRLAQVAPGTPPVVYSPQLCYWRVLDRAALSPHVLFRWMRSSAFREQLDRHAGQTDMAPYVNLRDQRSFKIAVPDSAAQMMIEPLLAAIDARIALLYRESDTLAELRDTLLPCLLSGELRVGDVQRAVALAT